uniref:Uncharacterized protein n=1 Tax=Oryza brachyantha TaxID=4533 RepID=J3M5P1_ORYBR
MALLQRLLIQLLGIFSLVGTVRVRRGPRSNAAILSLTPLGKQLTAFVNYLSNPIRLHKSCKQDQLSKPSKQYQTVNMFWKHRGVLAYSELLAQAK